MTLQTDWARAGLDWICRPGEGSFWSGARLILIDKTFTVPRLDDSITLESVGFTKYKMTRLNAQYFVEDAVSTAMMLHERNITRKKYASAAFHTYGHLLKGSVEKKSKRASVMGPCIQSVVVTLRPHEQRTVIDVFYRTTEWWKKYPADLVWLRQYIEPLIPGKDKYPVGRWRFHFVSITQHPMYFITLLPHLPDPIATFERLRTGNHAFWEWSGKWAARYLIGGDAGRSIEKFAQAMRTADAANNLITGDTRREIIGYLHKNQLSFIPKNTRFDRDLMAKAFDEAWEKIK